MGHMTAPHDASEAKLDLDALARLSDMDIVVMEKSERSWRQEKLASAVPQLIARVRDLESQLADADRVNELTKARWAESREALAEAERALESIHQGLMNGVRPGGWPPQEAQAAEAALQRIRAAKGETG